MGGGWNTCVQVSRSHVQLIVSLKGVFLGLHTIGSLHNSRHRLCEAIIDSPKFRPSDKSCVGDEQ